MSLGPPPRQLKRRSAGSLLEGGCLRLFILPHILVGIGVFLLVVSKLAMGIVGSRADASIIGRTATPSSKGGTSYHVQFTFIANRERYEGKSQMNQSAFNELPEQGRLPIVYLSFAPRYFAEYVPPGKTFPSNTWMLLAFALFWNAIVSLFAYPFYIAPWREKRLIKYGSEAGGKVLAKRLTRGSKGGTRCNIDYTYEVLGTKYKGKTQVSQRLYDATPEGAPLSVVYDPVRPKRSGAVELSEWEVVP